MLSISENLSSVKARIADACARAGRAPTDVTLIAVSKRQPDERLMAAYEAGQRDFGENYVQELVRKRELLPSDARWHLIGHLQTNKARFAVGSHLIHTVDSERVARALQKAASAADVVQDVLVEVNLAGEESKAGIMPLDVPGLVERVESHGHLRLKGLMCIPPVDEGRKYFSALRTMREKVLPSSPSAHLSMGMSSDYEDAIVEGATLVRVGTAIFGPRAS